MGQTLGSVVSVELTDVVDSVTVEPGLGVEVEEVVPAVEPVGLVELEGAVDSVDAVDIGGADWVVLAVEIKFSLSNASCRSFRNFELSTAKMTVATIKPKAAKPKVMARTLPLSNDILRRVELVVTQIKDNRIFFYF